MLPAEKEDDEEAKPSVPPTTKAPAINAAKIMIVRR